MKQLTLRVSDELAADLAAAAARRGTSVNRLATDGLSALVDPNTAGSEIDGMRERLARAGLLAELDVEQVPERPPEEALRRARDAAGRGTPLSELVSEGRGPR